MSHKFQLLIATKNIGKFGEIEEVLGDLENRIPAGRLGVPGDVAELAAFLASDAAEFISGQAINLTGGRELS